MSRFGTRPMVRVAAAVLAVGTLAVTMGGCSQIYLDRRDSIALSAGDALAANQAVQVIDPWPPRSGNTNIAFSGQRMQAAAERYRTNTIVQPVDPMGQQVTTGAAPLASSSYGNGTSSGTGTPNTTLVIGAPAAATAASQ